MLITLLSFYIRSVVVDIFSALAETSLSQLVGRNVSLLNVGTILFCAFTALLADTRYFIK